MPLKPQGRIFNDITETIGGTPLVRINRLIPKDQAVVLAALRQRLIGWRPAGLWNLGSAGFVVNVLALAYGLFAIVLLLKPAPGTETFLDRWIVAIGLVVVAGTGLLYLLLARPDRHSAHIPEGDAREVARQLHDIRGAASTGGRASR